MKRAADGLPDPLTGEFNGISAAFQIEGVQAFIPPEHPSHLSRRQESAQTPSQTAKDLARADSLAKSSGR
jgi:hypothetical protein